MVSTLADQCALDMQTDETLRKGVFAELKENGVVTFKDGSMLLDAKADELIVHDVMQRHNFEPYAFPTRRAEQTFWNLRHNLPSDLFIGGNQKHFQVVRFTGWESENGDQMRMPARFLAVEDLTKVVLACNEAEEISDEDLEAAAER